MRYFDTEQQARDTIGAGEIAYSADSDRAIVRAADGSFRVFTPGGNVARTLWQQGPGVEAADTDDEISLFDIADIIAGSGEDDFNDFFTGVAVAGAVPLETLNVVATVVPDEGTPTAFTLAVSRGDEVLVEHEVLFADTGAGAIVLSGNGVEIGFTIETLTADDFPTEEAAVLPFEGTIRVGQALPLFPLDAEVGSRAEVDFCLEVTNGMNDGTKVFALLPYIGGETLAAAFDVSAQYNKALPHARFKVVLHWVSGPRDAAVIAARMFVDVSVHTTSTVIASIEESVFANPVNLNDDPVIDVTVSMPDEDADLGWEVDELYTTWVPGHVPVGN